MTASKNIHPDENGITVAGTSYKYIEIEDELGFREYIPLCSSGSPFSKEKLDSIKKIFSDIIANTAFDKETQNLEDYTWSVDFEASPTFCSSIKVAKIGNISLSKASESPVILTDKNPPLEFSPRFYKNYQKYTLAEAFKSLLGALEERDPFSSDNTGSHAAGAREEDDTPQIVSRALSLSSSNSTSSSSNTYAASLSAPARKASLSQEKENEPEIFGEASILPIDSPSCSSVSSSSSSSSGSRFVPFMAQSVSPMPPLSLFSSTLPSLSHTLAPSETQRAPELSAPMHLMSSLPAITAASTASRPLVKPQKIVSVPEVHLVAKEKLQPCAMHNVKGYNRCPGEARVLRTESNKSGISNFMRIIHIDGDIEGQNQTVHFCSEKCAKTFEEIVKKAHETTASSAPLASAAISTPAYTNAALILPESPSSSSSSSSSSFMTQTAFAAIKPTPRDREALADSNKRDIPTTPSPRASRKALNPSNQRKTHLRLRRDIPS